MGNKKSHYRKVFKSDHLSVADLEDMLDQKHNLVFTIKEVRQEFGVRVAGKKGDFNIAYFNEDIKPLVLNAGNSKVMKGLSGGKVHVEDWNNITVRLYIDPNATLKGEVVGGVRISPKPPQLVKPKLLPGTDAWSRAVLAYKRDKNLDTVLKHCRITPENQLRIKEEAEA